MSMLQIGILGVAGVLLALQFKSGKSEYGIYISIALGMLIFASLLGKISLLKDVLNEVSNVVGLNSDYFKTLWKILGVTSSPMTVSYCFAMTICPPLQVLVLHMPSSVQMYMRSE